MLLFCKTGHLGRTKLINGCLLCEFNVGFPINMPLQRQQYPVYRQKDLPIPTLRSVHSARMLTTRIPQNVFLRLTSEIAREVITK